jgi:hypothetical protein
MSLQLEFEERPAYLVARFSGAGTLLEARQQFGLIAERCRSANTLKLLIDTTGAQLAMSFAERVETGQSAFVFARQGIRVAMLPAPEQVDPGKIGEMVAQNRGVLNRVCTSLAEAEAWLLE